MNIIRGSMPAVQRFRGRFLVAAFLGFFVAAACAAPGGSANPRGGTQSARTATPSIATAAAQNGASIVSLSDATAGATIYYTLDGSPPTTSSPRYFAPFLVASNLTVNAIAAAPGLTNSAVATRSFAPNIPSGTLVWSDEFSNSGASNAQPNPAIWAYETGYQCCGNHEQETYCAWNSASAPCNPASSNAFVGADGYLHIVAQQSSPGVYTSARLRSQGLFSFMYGRVEARMKLPESQGMWPAFWLLGNNVATVSWPACGEMDVMEHIDGSDPPFHVGAAPPGYDWIAGSVHGGVSSAAEVNGSQRYHPAGFSAAAWHIYGMIWTKGRIQYYVDSPSNIYATFNTASFAGTWLFDQGPAFLILNLAVGGDWPGNTGHTTVFPSTMLVDYVRIYAN